MILAIIEKLKAIAQQSDYADQSIRAAPAVAGATASVWTLNTWVMLATGLYIVVQIAYLARKWWREEKDYARKRKPRA